MQDFFHDVTRVLDESVQADEVYLATFAAEQSDFVRFNKSAVRQPGSVRQCVLSIELITGQAHAKASLALAGYLEQDKAALIDSIERLRETLAVVPDDPLLIYNQDVSSTETTKSGRLPDQDEAIDDILEIAKGRDLVGIYAAGPIYSGFANSFGQRNWHQSESFNFDWSFYHEADKAAKTAYAGFDWDADDLRAQANRSAAHLEVLVRPAKTLEPGRYRVYLAPSAIDEILSILNWGGFGLNARKTGQSPLLKMIDGSDRLAPSVSLSEKTDAGVAAAFQSEGFLKPKSVSLIDQGALTDSLVSPRSGVEFDHPTNGAAPSEMAQSLDMAPGTLPMDDVLAVLDTGLYVSNLWYLNFSDRASGRLTGMTRFATFWVEKGEMVAPIQAMRFDDTVYRMLGHNLVGLTEERNFILDPWSYEARATRSSRLPGAVIDDMTFTL